MLSTDMESKNEHRRLRKAHTEDRLGALTDDILLSILGRVDLTTAAKTSALSTRWRDLPWLLPELDLHVRVFLPAPYLDIFTTDVRPIVFYSRIPAPHIDQAMASLTKAAGSFLRTRHSANVAKLSLEIHLLGSYSSEIGSLVCAAIDNGMVKELDLAIADHKNPNDCKDVDMLQKALDVDGFFSAYPNMPPCITRLQLCNLRFAEVNMHHILFDCCKQLQHLTLDNCDAGGCSVWQINAPNSSLRVLEIYYSYLRLEVLCLPKLEQLRWAVWRHHEVPLRFGLIPSLKELFLLSRAGVDHPGISLSQLLNGATCIHTLTLNFQGEKLWIQPERTQFLAAFKKLRKLCIHGVYVEFDLLWTINLLEAAPTIEIFDIEIFEHPCQKPYWGRVGVERVQPSWKMHGFTSCNKWQLRELHFINFSPLLWHHMLFIRAIMYRAPNLMTVLLKEDEEPCKECEAIAALTPPVGGIFPRGQDQQEKIVKQLKGNMVSSSPQIIFSSIVSTVVF